MKKQFMGLMVIFFAVISIVSAQSICVDAGHGGTDPGAVGWGLQEKVINLDVSNRLYTVLQNAGYKVYRTRSGDSFVELSSRTSYANSVGASRFISIHCNAFNQSAHGTETFCYSSGSSTSFNMRDKVHPKIVTAFGTTDRGVKTASYYVLKYTNMPAILCELAFIDNQQDAAKLGDAYYRQKAAEAIKNGLRESLLAVEREMAEGDEYVAPRFSPDGKSLLVSKPGYHGLYLVSLQNGEKKTLNQESRIGYGARWISDQEIACVQKGERDSSFVLNTDGVKSSASPMRGEVVVTVSEDQIWVEIGGEKKKVSEGEDTYFNPVLSPNEEFVVYESLHGGIHISGTRKEFYLSVGKGNNPVWSSDSKQVFYDIASDNGHMLLKSDVWMVSMDDPEHRVRLTHGNLLAQRPSISHDGSQLSFDAEGKIFVASFNGKSITDCKEVKISK